MSEKAGWGILGTGTIGATMAHAIQESRLGRIVAIGSRDKSRADALAQTVGALRSYGSYQEVLDDAAVEFIYIATPHSHHVEWVIAAAAAGKHILCEKPLAVNARGARAAIDAVRKAGVFMMEGFAFRVHPQYAQLKELLEAGEIGDIRLVNARFGFDAGPSPANYLHNPALAGGAILDNGCYSAAMTRFVAGTTVGRWFRNPDRFFGVGLMDKALGVDFDGAAVTWCEGGFTAQLVCTMRTEVDKTVLITGSKGFIRLPAAFLPGRMDRFGGTPRIIVERHDREPREIVIKAESGLYTNEADAVVSRARDGMTEAPEMTWLDSIGNMELLDQWRAAVGVRYSDAVENAGCP